MVRRKKTNIEKVEQAAEIIETTVNSMDTETNEKVSNSFFSDSLDIDDIFPITQEVEQVTEEISPTIEKVEKTTPTVVSEEVKEEIDLTLPLEDISLKVFLSVKDADDRTVKKETALTSDQLLPLINAWLLATNNKKQFLEDLAENKHNALVIYQYPAIEWFVQPTKTKIERTLESIFLEYISPIAKALKLSPLNPKVLDEIKDRKTFNEMKSIQRSMIDAVNGSKYHQSIRVVEEIRPQLRHREDKSEKVAEIRNRNKSVTQRTAKEALPVIGSLYHISPIKTKDQDGNIYLTQTYLKRVGNEYFQSFQNIAWFDGGVLHYYSDYADVKEKREDLLLQGKLHPIITEHNLYPLIKADGVDIFPDLSIRMIGLEYLKPERADLWTTETRTVLRDNTNQPLDPQKSAEILRELKLAQKDGLGIDSVNLDGILLNHLGLPVTEERLLIAPKKFNGFTHPNLAIKSPRVQIKTEQKIPKPPKLDGEKVAQGSLMMRAIIGNIPMLLTIEPSDTKWNLIALPLRVPHYDLAVYLSDKLNKRELAFKIQSFIDELERLRIKNEVQIKLLQSLLTNLLDNDRFPTRQEVLDSTRVLDRYLKNEHIKQKSAYSDNYYRLYTLGYAKIVQKVEEELPTYTLTIIGDERDTRRSEIPTAIRWLKTQSNIIQKHFAEKLGSELPSYSDVKKFLMSTFPYHKSISMIITDKEDCLIELYYNNKLQTRQSLRIAKPANQNKIYGSEGEKTHKTFGKLPVKVSTTLTWTNDSEFKHLLRCDSNDQRLIINARNQIESITQKFVNSNLKRFVGEEKIITRKPVKEILGFGKDARNYGQIQRTFFKFATPYTIDSEVDKGKMINLHTLEVYDRHDVTKLLELMTANWKKWSQDKPEKIDMGGCEFKPIDPGAIMIQVHNTIKNNPHLDAIIWGELLDHLYLMTKLPIGFRCNNGVLLTPWNILPDKADLWAYRLKIQYIDILYKGKKSKVELAEYFLAQDSQELKDKGKELRDSSRVGQVQSWLEYPIKKLEDALNDSYPQWKKDISENLSKHIDALIHNYSIASQVK